MDKEVVDAVQNLSAPVPGRESPTAVVVVDVLVDGNFDPKVNPVDAVPAAGAVVVFVVPNNEFNKGVGEVLAGTEKLRESPVVGALVAEVTVADWLIPPRVNPPALVVV